MSGNSHLPASHLLVAIRLSSKGHEVVATAPLTVVCQENFPGITKYNAVVQIPNKIYCSLKSYMTEVKNIEMKTEFRLPLINK